MPALVYHLFGPLVKLVEIVGSVEFLLPLEAEPLDVLLDGVHVLSVFLGGVRVVVAEVGLAAVFLGKAEVDAEALGVAEVQVSVGLRREAGEDGRHLAGLEVFFDYFFEEIQGLLFFFHSALFEVTKIRFFR